MNLVINGENQTSSAGTLSALVEQLGVKADRLAIELNREIVPRDLWAQTHLREGDRLEIVHFVGGGSSSESGHSFSDDASRSFRVVQWNQTSENPVAEGRSSLVPRFARGEAW